MINKAESWVHCNTAVLMKVISSLQQKEGENTFFTTTTAIYFLSYGCESLKFSPWQECDMCTSPYRYIQHSFKLAYLLKTILRQSCGFAFLKL